MDIAEVLITLGAILLAALVVHWVGNRTILPRASLLMLLGLALGPLGFDLLGESHAWFSLFSQAALAMVGFLLGGEFRLQNLRGHGIHALVISAVSAAVTASSVVVGLLLLGFPPISALLLGGVAPATAPAATLSVVQELNSHGKFTTTLKRIVAIDDVWGLLVFSVMVAIAGTLTTHQPAWSAIGHGLGEIFGAVLLGLALGYPMAKLTGRLRPGEPTLLEALGSVFLCAGAALSLGVSPLLANVVLGTSVANIASHHTRPFHEIENVETPFLVLFFVLAGATLELDQLVHTGPMAVAYVGLRILGRIVGVQIGARATRASRTLRNWLAPALLAQAGVALGLAISAADRFPHLAEIVLPVVVVSTVLFELIGPPLTKLALLRSGEVPLARHG